MMGVTGRKYNALGPSASVGDTRGSTLLDLLLTNKKEVVVEGKADRNFVATVR